MMAGIEMRHVPYRGARQGLTCSFGFELQGPCSAFTSWGAHIRDPKTFPLAAHNQELVLRHMTFALQQLFQISFERGLCFNHCIERFLYRGRQIICIDVLPLQFFLCHCFGPSCSSRGPECPKDVRSAGRVESLRVPLTILTISLLTPVFAWVSRKNPPRWLYRTSTQSFRRREGEHATSSMAMAAVLRARMSSSRALMF